MSGVVLTDTEVMALALRLFARHLMFDDWLDWGDVPELTESTFEAGLEMKHEAFGKRWDEVPPHYEAQALWQIHVTGLERVFFAVLRGRTLDTDHVVDRDDAEIAFIVERAEQFWHDHVLAGVPPAVDGSDATLAAIAQVWPEHTPGDAVELTSAAVEALDLLAEAKAAKKEAETAEKTAKAVIATCLGDAEEGLLDGHRAVTYRAQVRTTTHTCSACGHVDSTTSDPFRVLRPVKSKETNR